MGQLTAKDRQDVRDALRRAGVRTALDGALVRDDERDIADSATANRILKAVVGTLDENDLGVVLGMLQDKGLISDDEQRDILASLSDAPDEGIAEDRRRRHAMDGSASFFARYPGARHIKVDPYQPAPPPSSRAAMFPNYNRLK